MSICVEEKETPVIQWVNQATKKYQVTRSQSSNQPKRTGWKLMIPGLSAFFPTLMCLRVPLVFWSVEKWSRVRSFNFCYQSICGQSQQNPRTEDFLKRVWSAYGHCKCSQSINRPTETSYKNTLSTEHRKRPNFSVQNYSLFLQSLWLHW